MYCIPKQEEKYHVRNVKIDRTSCQIVFSLQTILNRNGAHNENKIPLLCGAVALWTSTFSYVKWNVHKGFYTAFQHQRGEEVGANEGSVSKAVQTWLQFGDCLRCALSPNWIG